MVVSEYQKRNFHLYEHIDFSFWQDAAGNEIDLLWQEDRTLQTVEIKATKTITNDLFKQLDKFEAQAKMQKPIHKILVYGGTDNQQRTNYEVKSWKAVM